MSKLRLTFYGDDFTGSTDALEQLALAGVKTMLFIAPPEPAQLKRFPGLEAIGVAGMTRSLKPGALEAGLRPALKKLKALGAPHVHYKVCSTFDSSPVIGSIGRAMDVAAEIFRAPFVPVLAAAPSLGRYTIFGTHFARFGTAGDGEIHRLDRHPSVSHHPVTPMSEADLRRHLAAQTRKRIALFDILKIALPERASASALKKLLAGKPDAVLFDAFSPDHIQRIGMLMDGYATAKRPLFSVGSSGIEMALAMHWRKIGRLHHRVLSGPVRRPSKKPVLVGSGSCSPVTAKQIGWALRNGFAEVALDPMALASARRVESELARAAAAAVKLLMAGRSVIVHTTRTGSDRRMAGRLKHRAGEILGTALGTVLRRTLAHTAIQRVCIAGGDTSSFAARALGIEALAMIAPLTPGAPLCRVFAPGSPADGLEFVFKGGQVGGENYFGIMAGANCGTDYF